MTNSSKVPWSQSGIEIPDRILSASSVWSSPLAVFSSLQEAESLRCFTVDKHIGDVVVYVIGEQSPPWLVAVSTNEGRRLCQEKEKEMRQTLSDWLITRGTQELGIA